MPYSHGMSRFGLTTSAIVLLLTFAAAQPPAPRGGSFTLRQAMDFAFPSELTAAQLGERVAWVFDIRGVRNVWTADGPEFQPRQVTHYTADDGGVINGLRLTPDGRTAVYALGHSTHDGHVPDPSSLVTPPQQDVWAVDLDGPVAGQPRALGVMNCSGDDNDCEDIQLSPDGQRAAWAARGQIWVAPVSGAQPARQLCYARGHNTDPRWSPNGQAIAFASKRGDHGFIAVYRFGDPRLTYLAPSVDRDSLPRWSPDGRQIAYVRRPGLMLHEPIAQWRPQTWQIWLANVDTGRGQAIFSSGDHPQDTYPGWQFMPGDFLFTREGIVMPSWRDGHMHVYLLSPQGGALRKLTAGDFDVKSIQLTADGRSLLYSSNQNDVDRRHIWDVSLAGGPQRAITSGDTIEWTPVQTGDGRYLLCLGSSGTVPAMPFLIGHGERRMLAGWLIQNYPSAEMVTPKQVLFRSPDGRFELHGQLFVPRGRRRPGPALVFIHGGSMRQMMLGFHPMGYYHNAYAENEYLVNQGFIVLSVNYRSGIMYGFHFRYPEHYGARGASEYQDVLAAGRYLQQLRYVDPNRIGLWGGSWGGFLTAMGLAKNSDVFKAGVDMHGVHVWRLHDPTASDLAAAKALAWKSSPDAYVSTWKSPVLLIQGDDDPEVCFCQTVDLVQRLRAAHVPFQQLVFPDETHEFLRWHTWMRAYQATADFLEKYLMPARP
ncbi:MAG: S9 family peptidase [Terriglobales bacterium]